MSRPETGRDPESAEQTDSVGPSSRRERAHPICAFDVDGTLIGSIRSERLRPGAAAVLAALGNRDICILWSAGGSQYAQKKAVEHGISHHFVAFYSKFERSVDGRYVVHHIPSDHRPDIFVDDSPIDLPLDAAIVSVPQFLGGNGADRGLSTVVPQIDVIVSAMP